MSTEWFGEKRRNMGKNLYILSELFYPDHTSTGYIMTEIAQELAEDGIVNVICGPSGTTTEEDQRAGGTLNSNIKVSRIKMRNWNKNKVIQRIIRLLILSFKMASLLNRRAKNGDKVVVVTNPAPLLLLVARICKWKKLKFIIIVHDVFPENLKAANMISDKGIIYRFLLTVFNKAYDSADRLIVLGRDMKDVFLEKISASDQKVTVITNWSDTENVYPIENVLTGSLKIQFAGNFGRLQGLLPLLEAIKKAKNENLSVDFIGSGAMLGKMKLFIEENKISQTKLFPAFNRSAQNLILNNCDICFVSLAGGMKGLGVPSKTYNILAAGKPIIYIGDPDSEIAKLVDEHNIGWKFDSYGDKLILFLKELTPDCRKEIMKRGNNARLLALNEYSKSSILDKYKKAIFSV